jgi:hypothetical protein
MLYPLSILAAALAAAAFTAYGADPRWMLYPHGYELIMLSRRLQWPLVVLALLACATVLALVVGGRWRVWWLIGLAPILALFAHRFVTDPARAWQVDADAAFVFADQAWFVADTDWVVGLSFDGEDYAYPYSVLYDSPIVSQAAPRRRLVLIWSPFANRAIAAETDWTFKPRELEIVSMPANALLIYNGQLGQFINGVTGLTPSGQEPIGWLTTVSTDKMPFGLWKKLHPDTRVLQPPDGWRPGGPTAPLAPRYPVPHGTATDAQVALIDTPLPLAVRDADVPANPVNLLAGTQPLLLMRDASGLLRAYQRQANGDLTPRFFPVLLANHPTAALSENDSNSLWTADGRAIDGPLKGEKLKPFDVDDGVNLSVAAYWYPNLTLLTPTPADIGQWPVKKQPQRLRGHRTRPAARRRTELTISS